MCNMDYAMFRSEAQKHGLTVERGNTYPYFYFDLNQGSLCVQQSPEKIYELVCLAMQYADSPDYGEHNALLSLVTEWSGEGFDLTSSNIHQPKCIYWHRPYYTQARQHPEKWITLKNWLAREGFAVNIA